MVNKGSIVPSLSSQEKDKASHWFPRMVLILCLLTAEEATTTMLPTIGFLNISTQLLLNHRHMYSKISLKRTSGDRSKRSIISEVHYIQTRLWTVNLQTVLKTDLGVRSASLTARQFTIKAASLF